ncbi:MAG: Crp/Fnr family transcriptional regulator [Verrucomicrobiota bacterium JB022]|nr:Crp/Fnr family transcriptional regulator [Verrucomicrobiota bacterium JB022]
MATPASSIRAAVLHGTLKQCPLFSALSDSALAEVAATCRLRGLAKGEYLFHEGDPAEGFFVVQAGAINAHRISPDGREQVIRVFRPYASFAEIALSEADRYPVHAVAIEPSQVILIQRRPLRELIQRNPDIAFHIISSMSNHFRHLVQLLEDQKFKDIEGRLSHWLLRQLEETGQAGPGVVQLDTSKKLLANRLGVASETLSRAFARFRDAGWIEVDGARIRVLEPEALRTMLATAE